MRYYFDRHHLEGAKQTADAVKALGRKSVAFKVDITKGDDVDAVVKAALKEMGKIDILVNTAGGNSKLGDQFLESKQETWEKDMALNLYGTMNCAKAFYPAMVERKWGKIINFSSIVARTGIGGPVSIPPLKPPFCPLPGVWHPVWTVELLM